MATIGVDFRFKTIQIDGKTVKFQIWDTAGSEKFQSINHAYFRGADGCLLCYDVCREQTFNNILFHLEQVQEKEEKNSCKILVANKCDQTELRQVEYGDGFELACNLSMPFFELSSKLNQNVHATFVELGRQCIANKLKIDKAKSDQNKEIQRLQQRDTGSNSNRISLDQFQQNSDHSYGCC